MTGAGTPGDEDQRPWTVRPGQPQYGAGGDDPFPSHTYGAEHTHTPQQPFAPRQPFGTDQGGDRPDWSALAARQDARARRRRRAFAVGGGAAGLVAVGGIVAVVVATSGGGSSDEAGKEPASPTPSAFEAAKPSFKPAPTVPPAPEPQAILADPKLDTAPFTAASLFPDKEFTVNGRAYTVLATKATNTCSDAVDAPLASALRNQQCTQLIRLTVTGPGGTAATAAVASFPAPAKASAVMNGKDGGALTALPGGSVKNLCPKTQKCLRTRNALGRYAMLTIAGHANGKSAETPDKPLEQASDDLNKYLRASLTQRGQAASDAIDAENRRKALEQVKG